MSGFKKCGIHPLNASSVSRLDNSQNASSVSRLDNSQNASSVSRLDNSQDASSVSRLDNSQDASSVSRLDNLQDASSVSRLDNSQDTLSGRADLGNCDVEYRRKYEEGYDIYTEDYLKWIRDNHLPLLQEPEAPLLQAHQYLPVLHALRIVVKARPALLVTFTKAGSFQKDKWKTSSKCREVTCTCSTPRDFLKLKLKLLT